MKPYESIPAGENRDAIDTSELAAYISINNIANEKHQLVIFTIHHSVRRTLPYGKWTLKDGSEVLFNREYQPLLWRLGSNKIHGHRAAWMENIIREEFFYNDSNSPVYYLIRKVSAHAWTEEQIKDSQRSLLICLTLLREFAPKRTSSEEATWGLTTESLVQNNPYIPMGDPAKYRIPARVMPIRSYGESEVSPRWTDAEMVEYFANDFPELTKEQRRDAVLGLTTPQALGIVPPIERDKEPKDKP